MKKKLFMLLALVMTAMTASAYDLTVGTSEHGTITFKIDGTTATSANENDVVTVEVTPDENWSMGSVKGLWYAAGAAQAPRRVAPENIGLLKDFELTPVEGNANAFTFVMKRANVEISATYRKMLTHQDITIADIAAVTYNGQAQTPAVTVKDGSTVLTKDTDFSVSYESNLNAGTATATLVGIGDYSGQVVKTFTIQKADLQVTAPTARELTYTGVAQTLINAATLQGAGNTDACEIQYSLDNQTWATALPEGTNAGSYTVFYKAVADANHNGVAAAFINVPIYKAALTTVLIAETNLVYNKQEQQPVITGVKAGTLDVPAADYTYAGSATEVGTYTVTATAKANAQNFTGQATTQFSIVAADANLFTLTVDPEEFTYNGEEQKPTVTVKDGDAVLVEGTDYTLSYENNVNVGTATVTATGKGNYEGTKLAQYSIVKADITPTAPTAKTGLVYTTQAQLLINAGSAEGGELQYSLDGQSWSTNIPTGVDAKDYTVYYRVVADANHNDVAVRTLTVTIDKAALTAVTLTETNFTYNQQEQTALVALVTSGQMMVSAEEYEVSGNKATNAGNYTVTVTGKGNYKGSVTAQFSIVAANANLFELTLNPTEFTYNGQEQKPTVTVKDGSAVLVKDTDYTLAFTNNVNAGTATVTATGMGNYTGTKTATYVINPAELTSVTLAQTQLTYNQQEQTVSVSAVKAGTLNVNADSYDVSGNKGTTVGTYTVTVTGKGNFKGQATAQFSIVAADATALFDITLDNDVFDADGTEQKPVVTVKDGNATLVAGTDYTVSYQNNVNVGTATVTVTGKGNYEGTKTAQFTIVRDMSTVFSEGNSWTTYVAQEDLTLPEGIEAYAVTGATATEVSAEAISYIPTGVGVLLNRSDVTKTDFKGYAYEGATATIESLLVGSATEATKLGDYKDFLLFRDEFVMSSTNSIPAGRAYLPAAEVPANAAPALVIAFGDVTGVKEVREVKEVNDDSFYDMNGRKVLNPTKKGVYIMNGKKVVVK